MNIIKLWALVYEDRKVYSTGQYFGSDYISNYRYVSLHYKNEDANNAILKYGYNKLTSCKEVIAMEIGNNEYIVLGLVEDAMLIS